jgi:hypothetical protein
LIHPGPLVSLLYTFVLGKESTIKLIQNRLFQIGFSQLNRERECSINQSTGASGCCDRRSFVRFAFGVNKKKKKIFFYFLLSSFTDADGNGNAENENFKLFTS